MQTSWITLRRAGVIVAMLATTTGAAPANASANPVDDWNAIAAQTIGARGAAGVLDFAYVHIAIYDAVNAIDGRRTVFAVRPSFAPRRASLDAATAAAAYSVLIWLYPEQRASLDAAYAAYMAGLPANSSTAAGVKVGKDVGQALIALRTGDGRNAVVSYTPGSGPGVYQFTPGCTAAVTPWMAQMKTFGVKDSTQFRAAGPPDLSSTIWAADFNETKAYGAATGSLRTPAQTGIGLFYTEYPSTWNGRNIRAIAQAKHLSLVDAARFYAQVFVTASDSLLTVWNSKFHFSFWRPTTAIRQGDTDGNAATVADPAWLPLATTPCHPEYPAAHGAATGGIAYALEYFFGTPNINVTLSSTSVPTAQPLAYHSFATTHDLVQDVIAGRIYGGMHYRTSGEDGARMGKQVARYVSSHDFRRVDDDDHDRDRDRSHERDHDRDRGHDDGRGRSDHRDRDDR